MAQVIFPFITVLSLAIWVYVVEYRMVAQHKALTHRIDVLRNDLTGLVKLLQRQIDRLDQEVAESQEKHRDP